MRLIRPAAIDDAQLVASSVALSEAAYNAATRYNAGAVVRSGHTKYEALTPGTSQVITLTIASPCVVSWTNHGLANGTEVLFETAGSLPTGITAGTVYFVVSAGTNDFRIAATAGGAAINTSGSQSGVHTVYTRPNKGKDPAVAANSAFWLNAGPVNRWAMFDDLTSTRTTDTDEIEVEVNIPARVDAVAMINVSAASAQVVMKDSDDVEVFNETRSLVSTEGIVDWYAYFFEPISRITDLVFDGLPRLSDATITATLTGTGETVGIGALVIGQTLILGETEMGAEVGIRDYNRQVQNDFGEWTITERGYSDTGNFRVLVERGRVDQVKQTLTRFRGVPIVYFASDAYAATLIYGRFKSYVIAIEQPDYSYLSIDIEGLNR